METQNKEITVMATLDNLDMVVGFVEESLNTVGCPMKTCMQIIMCVEEIYVNVASYAYGAQEGNCTIRFEAEYSDSSGSTVITIVDSGSEFDPLQKKDPDITLSADEREIGGLGIFMVKKSMDNIKYSYENENNILRLEKSW